MQTEMRYSLRQLSKATKYHFRTLKSWKDKGWLVPSGTTGTHLKYTMSGLKKAESHSLMALNNKQVTVKLTAEQFLLTLN